MVVLDMKGRMKHFEPICMHRRRACSYFIFVRIICMFLFLSLHVLVSVLASICLCRYMCLCLCLCLCVSVCGAACGRHVFVEGGNEIEA